MWYIESMVNRVVILLLATIVLPACSSQSSSSVPSATPSSTTPSPAPVSSGKSADYPPYAVPKLQGVTVPGLPAITSRIHVDQFGYLPDSAKCAILSDPQKGYNEAESYTPGAKLEVRTRDGKTVFSGAPTIWNEGKVHEDSGDRGWWFDFSTVKTPGEYYIFDPTNNVRSAVFKVADNVFAPILRDVSRVFYYQRLGVDLKEPYAEKPWTEAAGLTQDSHARSVEAKDDPKSERDLSGGWMDAGDTNKYPPFNGEVIHPLLYAYTANPKVFGDANGIPESGNNLPDLLDEVKVQLDWLLKMQFPDGAVPVKMGNIDYNGKWPLSDDKRPRYYGPKDSGAAIITAGNFAHAARVYSQFPAWKEYAQRLRTAAVLSWDWFQSHPRTFKSDTGEIKSGGANRSNEEQDRYECFAAIHLFALTGDEKYHAVVKTRAGTTRQMSEYLWSPYDASAAEALAEYTTFKNADPALAEKIKAQLQKSAVSDQWAPAPTADLYRAWMVPTSYHWGSTTVRANYGTIALLAARYGGVSPADAARLKSRAADLLHSFHGVNPLTLVYLSNMGRDGAELSVSSIYHERYNVSTPFVNNPPPGYVVGGPNQSFSGKAADGAPSVEWLKTQPRAKAYADFNKAWPESSWELSEPAIYYQSTYIRLLAESVR